MPGLASAWVDIERPEAREAEAPKTLNPKPQTTPST